MQTGPKKKKKKQTKYQIHNISLIYEAFCIKIPLIPRPLRRGLSSDFPLYDMLNQKRPTHDQPGCVTSPAATSENYTRHKNTQQLGRLCVPQTENFLCETREPAHTIGCAHDTSLH
jgi:hypothetical protein